MFTFSVQIPSKSILVSITVLRLSSTFIPCKDTHNDAYL